MKQLNLQLELDNPCSADLEKMAKVSNGFYCNHCEKKVIDMVNWDDKQILEYFNNNPSKVCVRIHQDRLGKRLHVQQLQDVTPRYSNKFLTILFSILGYLNFNGIAKSNLGTSTNIINQEDKNVDDIIIISGKVTHEGLPLNHVEIRFLGNLYYTDSSGNYKIELNKVEINNSLIQFSYSEFSTITRSYNISMGSTNYDINFYTRENNYPIVAGGINPTFFIPSNWSKTYLEIANKQLDVKCKNELNKIASLMRSNPNFGMAIQGYYFKDSLSVKRNLNLIKNYLVENQGIDPERIFLNKVIKTSIRKEESRFYFVAPTYE